MSLYACMYAKSNASCCCRHFFKSLTSLQSQENISQVYRLALFCSNTAIITNLFKNEAIYGFTHVYNCVCTYKCKVGNDIINLTVQ